MRNHASVEHRLKAGIERFVFTFDLYSLVNARQAFLLKDALVSTRLCLTCFDCTLVRSIQR